MRARVSFSVVVLILAACSPEAGTSGACVAVPDDMVWIPGGVFKMGDGARYSEEGPERLVSVDGFWMDRHEVTNAEFESFVRATGYRTMAERNPPVAKDTPPDMLLPGSAVFTVPTGADPRWWRWVVGAQWRHPSGPSSNIDGRGREPVVQVANQDALAFARWKGKMLPSEVQWEFAARGGMDAIAEPTDTKGRPQANYYQGAFPAADMGTDGYKSRAPVGCFKPNGYGLHDMIGNVWEWTRDTASNATATEPAHIIKGGSFLCAANYCARYRPAARQFQESGLGTDHIGFRLVDNERPAPK